MRRPGRRHGQAAVEFALTIPLLLILIVGAFDIGRGVLATTSLANAVREAARAGAAAYPATGWETRAANHARSSATLLDFAALSINVAQVTAGGATFVTVTGQYRFYPIAPYLSMMQAEIPLTSSSRMRAG
jgi:Flp pilus assembly protein TadG